MAVCSDNEHADNSEIREYCSGLEQTLFFVAALLD